MNPRLEELFHEARTRSPGADRRQWIEHQCDGNAALLTELEALLAAHSALQELEKIPSEPPPDHLVPDTTFGPYRPVSVLGRGGMSVVYYAERVDGAFDQKVALKVMSGAFAAGEEFVRRFRTECRLLASLHHHNIPALLDGGISPAGLYLATELVDGLRIDQYCDQHHISIEARLRLVLQICDAVEFAHRNLIVHRDLKPANILVNREGTVKLLDFGTALLLSSEEPITVTYNRMLTPRYASPEQLRGERAGVESDLFSLAVVAYELVAGAWPFGDPRSMVAELNRAAGETDISDPHVLVTEEAAHARATSLSALRQRLKGDISSILKKALEAEPSRRYNTVRDLADDIRRYLDGRPVEARGNSRAYRVGRSLWRIRGRVAAVAAVMACLCAAGLYGVREYGREQRRMVELRDLNTSFLNDVYREVSRLPGSTKACLLIVERTRSSLDALFAGDPRDVRTRLALAAAYIQLGDVQGEPFAISLGDSAGALTSYGKAEFLASRDAHPGPEEIATLLRARLGIASLRIRAGEYSAVPGTLQSSLEQARPVVERTPGMSIAGQRLSAIYIRADVAIGHALMRDADVTRDIPMLRRALAQFQSTVQVAGELQRLDPGLPDLASKYSQYVGYAYELLGDFTKDRSYYELALTSHARCAEGDRAIFQAAPTPQNRRNYADALCEYGWCEHLCGRQQAVETLSRAVALMEQVARANADSSEAQLDLATVYGRLGSAEVGVGDLASGIRHLDASRRLIRMPKTLRPADRELVVLFARVQEAMADAYAQRARYADAAEALEQAVQAAKQVSSLPEWRLQELQQELLRARESTSARERGARSLQPIARR